MRRKKGGNKRKKLKCQIKNIHENETLKGDTNM